MNPYDEKDVAHAMNNHNHIANGDYDINDVNSPSDDVLHTMREMRAAMLKRSVAKPNVDEEWNKVSNQLGFAATTVKEVPLISRPRRGLWMASGIAIGAVASLLVIMLIKAFSPSTLSIEGNYVRLYSAVDERQKIEMSIVTDTLDESISLRFATKVTETPSRKVADYAVQSIDDEIEVIDIRKVEASSEMEERVIRTPIGKEIRIILADNTQVLLGSESSLRFPVRFPSDERRVWLEGEAYFDVKKESSRKFNVVSQNYITTALGTEFDVKAYSRADVKVSLIEGSVRVEDINNSESVVLQPGQDVKCVGGKLIVSEIDTKAYSYWKDGYFYFAETPLVDMLLELGRWYNVNIELGSRQLMSYKMHFVARRDENVSEIAERLNLIGSFKVDFDGKTLKIYE